MSIVRLSEWFPFNDEQHEIIVSIISFIRCHACGKKCRFRKAVGHHSLPWGYGELWCSWKCCESGKVARPDRRRERRLRRKYSAQKSVQISVQISVQDFGTKIGT